MTIFVGGVVHILADELKTEAALTLPVSSATQLLMASKQAEMYEALSTLGTTVENQKSYVAIAYADDELGSGISTSAEGKVYMGIDVNQPTRFSDISNPSSFSWSRIGDRSVTVQLMSSAGTVFKNNTGVNKVITANVYIDGYLSEDTSNYKYTWRSGNSQAYINTSGEYVQDSPAVGLYPADGTSDLGLNTQTIVIDPSDVSDGGTINITCEITNI